MEGGAIVESQISASSVHFGILGLQRWGPELARLNNQGIVNAWTSATHDRNPWIEVREANTSEVMRLTHESCTFDLTGDLLTTDQCAEEDAPDGHHHAGCQSHGHG